MFIRSTQTDGRTYYRVVDAKWVDGKSKQISVIGLGEHETVEDAIKAKERALKALRKRLSWFSSVFPAEGQFEAQANAAFKKERAAKLARVAKLEAEVAKLKEIAPDVRPYQAPDVSAEIEPVRAKSQPQQAQAVARDVRLTSMGQIHRAMGLPTGDWAQCQCGAPYQWGYRVPAPETYDCSILTDRLAFILVSNVLTLDLNDPAYLSNCPARSDIEPFMRQAFDAHVHDYRFVMEVFAPLLDESEHLRQWMGERVEHWAKFAPPSEWVACDKCEHRGMSSGDIEVGPEERRTCPKCKGKAFVMPRKR